MPARSAGSTFQFPGQIAEASARQVGNDRLSRSLQLIRPGRFAAPERGGTCLRRTLRRSLGRVLGLERRFLLGWAGGRCRRLLRRHWWRGGVGHFGGLILVYCWRRRLGQLPDRFDPLQSSLVVIESIEIGEELKTACRKSKRASRRRRSTNRSFSVQPRWCPTPAGLLPFAGGPGPTATTAVRPRRGMPFVPLRSSKNDSARALHCRACCPVR